MKSKKLVVLILAAIVSTVLIFSGCGATQTNSSNKVEGKISLYTSQPDADAQALVDAFTKKYPNTTIEIFRSGTEEVISKLLAEKEAGSIMADVLLVADSVTFEGLKAQDLLLKYQSPELKNIPSEFADKDGMYTGTKVITSGIIINTDLVKEEPTSWQVLTENCSKGQESMPSPLYSGAAAYNVGVISRTTGLGWEFFENLKANEMAVGKGNGGVLTAVAAGEKKYGMVVDFIVARSEREGSPVHFIYPKEGVPAITEPVGILKNTKNEAVAKAFVDFIISEEGQTLASDLGYTPIRKGIPVPQGLKSIEEMKVLTADSKELLKARDEDKAKFEKIFN